MASAYPAALDNFTNKTDGVDDVMAADVNELQDAIEAVQAELGTDPAGSATDLATRLAGIVSAAGHLQVAAATALTISSGAITITQNYHTVDTEAGAGSDDLVTINGYEAGRVLFLRNANAARAVVLKAAGGNIALAGNVDGTIITTNDLAILVYDGALAKWVGVVMSGAGLLAAENTWANGNKFGYGLSFAYTAITAATTLTSAHYMVNCNAASGAITVTLPAAATNTGRVYIIRKSDSSANVVTIDGNASETINGAATYALSTQYSAVQLMCDGSGWMII